MSNPTITITPNVQIFIEEACKAFPDVMTKVLDMEFCDLWCYEDGRCEKMRDIYVPECGCLIGSIAIALFKTRTECAIKGIMNEYIPADIDASMKGTNMVRTLYAMIQSCDPKQADNQIFDSYNIESVATEVPKLGRAEYEDDENEYDDSNADQEEIVAALKTEIRKQLHIKETVK